MNVTLAFKKKESILDSVLAWWTCCDYTHVEIIIGDKWISSGPTAGGVYINDLRRLTDKWIYVDVNVDGRVKNTVLKFIKEQEGKEYDWMGIFLSQVFNTTRENQDKWFCSEIVSEILKRFRVKEINLPSVQYSPCSLWGIYGDPETTETTKTTK